MKQAPGFYRNLI